RGAHEQPRRPAPLRVTARHGRIMSALEHKEIAMETMHKYPRVRRTLSTTIVGRGGSRRRQTIKHARPLWPPLPLSPAAVVVLAALGGSPAHAAPPTVAVFPLYPNPRFAPCLAASSTVPPQARVEVNQGTPNDQLTLFISGVKPFLAFDLFTTE